MNMKNEKIKNALLLFMLILFMILLVNKTFQNDTFFSITIGKNIIANGIETEEKLVWHEGLEFTNPRWMFDILIARNL